MEVTFQLDIDMLPQFGYVLPRFHYAGELKADELRLYQNSKSLKMKQSQRPIMSFSPVVLPVTGRHVDLEIKVSAPVSGNNLPVILLSHGHGGSNFLSSYRGYGPVVDFFAAEGFVVVQPMLRSLTGQNAQQHIHNHLIEKAKEQLSTSQASISEIAYELGFEHPQSFSS